VVLVVLWGIVEESDSSMACHADTSCCVNPIF
jgi:hypothetical protein